MKNYLKTGFCLIAILFSNLLFAQTITERNLGNFEEVKIGGSFDVLLKKGDQNQIQIKAKGVESDEIITEVEGNTLNIRMKNGNYWNIDVDIILTYKNLNVLHSSGSSDIETANAIKTDNLEIKLSGSGDLKAEIDVTNFNLIISGSADAELKGKAQSQEVSISGSGDVKAFYLDCSTTNVKVSGSGDAKIVANENLEAKVSGSGQIRYKGNPNKQIVKVSGSGNVRKE